MGSRPFRFPLSAPGHKTDAFLCLRPILVDHWIRLHKLSCVLGRRKGRDPNRSENRGGNLRSSEKPVLGSCRDTFPWHWSVIGTAILRCRFCQTSPFRVVLAVTGNVDRTSMRDLPRAGNRSVRSWNGKLSLNAALRARNQQAF